MQLIEGRSAEVESIDALNRRLKQLYGKDLLGRALWRIVWSGKQIEKRMGKFNVFFHRIFLREEFGVKELPKYQGYMKPDRWVLEHLIWFPEGMNPELVQTGPDRGFYEPAWSFIDATNQFVPPVWTAIALIIHSIRNPKHMSPSDYADAEVLKEKKEIEQTYEEISNEAPELAHALKHGTAVVVPGGQDDAEQQEYSDLGTTFSDSSGVEAGAVSGEVSGGSGTKE